MTTDLDGKPMLMLKQPDVERLESWFGNHAGDDGPLENLYDAEDMALISKIRQWLADAKVEPPHPSFDQIMRERADAGLMPNGCYPDPSDEG